MGKVYLVGAGPGDPDLITVKGRDALQRAGAVLYDNLAAHELLDLAPRAEKIYVGKKKSDHSLPQTEISQLLVAKARQHAIVVRLKGGDPFIFGRGGEELEILHDEGIEYEVVPGVTSALGMAACTGVPLTHRDHASSVSFVTGHDPSKIDWSRVGHSETLVIYMGLSTAADIAARLIAAGRAPFTPALVVQRATTSRQHTVRTDLASLGEAVTPLKPPATIVIGEVAALGDKLDWFARRPLHNRTIVLLRAPEQSAESARALRDLGAHVVEAPVIALEAIDFAVPDLTAYDWLLFTSANAVRFFLAQIPDTRRITPRVMAIGPATAAALREYRIVADVVVENSVGEGVAEELRGVSGRVLLPRAAVARDVIPGVEMLPVYRNVVPPGASEKIAAIAHADFIVFTSSSTVKNFLALDGRRLLDACARAISIGPATSETMRAHGVAIAAEANPHTFDGVIDAIIG
ncbi:MAG: uroporphyrinogen-III C-methyltransferase [Acidobacteria bacterium]|nr:uroporphyrinogen-III C-methyltransferase [Acidobacteriota bacterium]